MVPWAVPIAKESVRPLVILVRDILLTLNDRSTYQLFEKYILPLACQENEKPMSKTPIPMG